MLRKPILAKCEDRQFLAKKNLYSGEPESWFECDYFFNSGYKIISFDFFVHWNRLAVNNEIWKKAIIEEQNLLNTDIKIIGKELKKIDRYIEDTYKFSKRNGFEFHYLIFPDKYNWSMTDELILDVNLTNNPFNPKLLTPKNIVSKISFLRGKSVSIGKAGLIYGTSSLECFLSNNKYFWPGDADIVILDHNFNPVAIIELKKHNLDSDIRSQNILNYRNRDRLKYESLGLLSKKFDCKLFVIYYPTKQHINEFKIEELTGKYNNLLSFKSKIIKLPEKNNLVEKNEVSKEILKFINNQI